MGAMKVPQAFPYQGSKRNLAPAILRYFPDGTGTLIEPFAGSCLCKRNHRTALGLRKARITMPFRA